MPPGTGDIQLTLCQVCFLYHSFYHRKTVHAPISVNLSKKVSQFHFVMINSNLQVVPLTAAVIVTTPQKLAFIDVAKGVRMFSKLKVCFLGL